MYQKEVTTKSGILKTIVASSQEELDEAVAAAKAEVAPVSPDLHNPDDANVIVSPDNLHTEVTPAVVTPDPEDEPVKVVKKKAVKEEEPKKLTLRQKVQKKLTPKKK